MYEKERERQREKCMKYRLPIPKTNCEDLNKPAYSVDNSSEDLETICHTARIDREGTTPTFFHSRCMLQKSKKGISRKTCPVIKPSYAAFEAVDHLCYCHIYYHISTSLTQSCF